jgi:hypothetical protein
MRHPRQGPVLTGAGWLSLGLVVAIFVLSFRLFLTLF